MAPVAGHEDDEVIGVANESVGRLAAAAAPLALPRVGAHLSPGSGEVIVQSAERDVGQQRGENPALRGAGQRRLEVTMLGHDPGLQERFDERQHTLVCDPPAHPVQQGWVVDAVETRLDVRLDDPLIRAAGEVVDLGDRVLRSASRPKPVGARLKVDLEDRFQHGLQSGLHDTIRNRRDPQPTALAAALGDHPLTDGHRPISPRSKLLTQLVEELLHAQDLLDVVGRLAVHSA